MNILGFVEYHGKKLEKYLIVQSLRKGAVGAAKFYFKNKSLPKNN